MKQNVRTKNQGISIQKLYKDAIDSNILPEAWPDFINNQLKSSSRWGEDRNRRGFQPKSSAMKPQYFEVIIEEEGS